MTKALVNDGYFVVAAVRSPEKMDAVAKESPPAPPELAVEFSLSNPMELATEASIVLQEDVVVVPSALTGSTPIVPASGTTVSASSGIVTQGGSGSEHAKVDAREGWLPQLARAPAKQAAIEGQRPVRVDAKDVLSLR